MGLIANIFNNPAFSLLSMTRAINVEPIEYGRIGELGLFTYEGVATKDIGVEREIGTMTALKTVPWGGPASKHVRSNTDFRSFRIPHVPYEDQILASDVAGQRELGTDNAFQTVVGKVVKVLRRMATNHRVTWELQRAGAIKGVLLDSDGSTLYNYFTEFIITEKVVDFQLNSSTTDVRAKVAEVLRHMKDNAYGAQFSSVRILCSRTFMDQLTAHPNVEKFFVNWQAANALSGQLTESFQFGGATFETYEGFAPVRNSTTGAFANTLYIPVSEARAVPIGTSDVFSQYGAPAEKLSTVNTIGVPMYASQEMLDHERGVEIQTEANSLFMCKRPGMLVRCTTP